ncbi:MAG: hypothetical protein ACI4TE_04940 [Alphaproteobacteria bacterium]
MKIHLLILIISTGILLCGNAMAKAVKLGRSNAYSIEAFSRFAGKTELIEKKCSNECLLCEENTGNCLKCPEKKRPSQNKCIPNCYNVICKTGFSTQDSADGCCCTVLSCPDGQKKQNASCVSNCSGVSCRSGYSAQADTSGCCCKAI